MATKWLYQSGVGKKQRNKVLRVGPKESRPWKNLAGKQSHVYQVVNKMMKSVCCRIQVVALA